MTKIDLKTTNYSVDYAEGKVKAYGNMTARVNKTIESLYVTISENDTQIGTANYSQYEGGANASYSYQDESKKDVVIATTDAIIADIKTQLTKA